MNGNVTFSIGNETNEQPGLNHSRLKMLEELTVALSLFSCMQSVLSI